MTLLCFELIGSKTFTTSEKLDLLDAIRLILEGKKGIVNNTNTNLIDDREEGLQQVEKVDKTQNKPKNHVKNVKNKTSQQTGEPSEDSDNEITKVKKKN